MLAYYNENDSFAAAWLRELMKAGVIAPGEVDGRDIREVRPEDLRGFTQCHFFAGIGVWSYALRQAGWPDEKRVWTGSCPCQPFSVSGKREGFSDERHLWPAWYALIGGCRPSIIFGEQVEAAIGSGLQKLRHGQGALGFRGEWEGRLSLAVQELYRSEEESERLSGESLRDHLSENTPGAGLGEAREATGGSEESAVRSGRASARDSSAIGRRSLRSYGSRVQPGGRSDVGQPLSGPEESESGLSLREPASGLPCGEQCDGGLGRAEDSRPSAGDHGEADGEIQRLVAEACREVEAENAGAWFDLVHFDLGRSGYTIGACCTPAAGFGAPHIRQRLYFCAHAEHADGRTEHEINRDAHRRLGLGRHSDALSGSDSQRDGGRADLAGRETQRRSSDGRDCKTGELPNPACGGFDGEYAAEHRAGQHPGRNHHDHDGQTSQRSDPDGGNSSAERLQRSGEQRLLAQNRGTGDLRDTDHRGLAVHGSAPGNAGYAERAIGSSHPGPTNGFWASCDWWYGRDGKFRPIEPGLFPLAHGAACRVGRLRGYGNALCAPQAEQFIRAAIEVMF